MTTRRTFLAGASAAALVSSRAVRSQQRVYRITIVTPTASVAEMTEAGTGNSGAFLREMRRLGFVEGQHLEITRYSGGGQLDQNDALARTALVGNPDLIWVTGSSDIMLILMSLTKTVPLVFNVNDGLATGLVTNLTRPGGNVTGANATPSIEIEGRRMEMLLQAVPGSKRVGAVYVRSLWESTAIANLGIRRVTEESAARLGLTLVPILVDDPGDDAAFRRAFAATGPIDILHVANSTGNNARLTVIAEVALERRWPAMATTRTFVERGGLMSYGPVVGELTGVRVAAATARILNGEYPGDIPVSQPTAFDFIINLKTAAALGAALPAAILAQATEIRE